MIRTASAIRWWLLLTLAGMSGAAPAADDLGRLFTTPAERAQLDEARRAAPLEPLPVVIPNTQGVKPVAIQGGLTLRGLVKRDAGRSTAWVNNSNSYEGDLDTPYRAVEKSGFATNQVTLKLPDGQASVKIKVAQTYEPASTRIRELGAAPDAAAAPVPAEVETDDE